MAFNQRSATQAGRVGVALGSFTFSALLLVALLIRPNLELQAVVAERNWLLETAQVWLWLLTALVAAVGCFFQPTRRGLLLLTWLAFVALLAGLRELDLHVVLNPANIHLLGLSEEQAVRFRSRWWLDGETSLALRLGWAAVFLIVGAMLLTPFALAGYPWSRQLRGRACFPWLIVSGFLTLGLAFFFDDAIGRPLQRAGVDLDLLEESTELLGQLLILLGVVRLALGKVDLCLPEPSPD